MTPSNIIGHTFPSWGPSLEIFATKGKSEVCVQPRSPTRHLLKRAQNASRAKQDESYMSRHKSQKSPLYLLHHGDQLKLSHGLRFAGVDLKAPLTELGLYVQVVALEPGVVVAHDVGVAPWRMTNKAERI